MHGVAADLSLCDNEDIDAVRSPSEGDLISVCWPEDDQC